MTDFFRHDCWRALTLSLRGAVKAGVDSSQRLQCSFVAMRSAQAMQHLSAAEAFRCDESKTTKFQCDGTRGF
jgi:hypothetical protein